jgi:Zn-dependent protease with chaperone function/Zn-finger nucleic acid-binding protein
MLICPHCKKNMTEVLSRDHVLVDICSGCRGVWFDRGEINHFVNDKVALESFYKIGLHERVLSKEGCSRCHVGNNPEAAPKMLYSGKFPYLNFQMEYCDQCAGIFLGSAGVRIMTGGLSIAETKPPYPKVLPRFLAPAAMKMGGKLPPLPSIDLASGGVFLVLYGILFGILVFLDVTGRIPAHKVGPIMLGIVILQFMVAPWISDMSLRLLGSLEWIEFSSLAPGIQTFVKGVCQRNHLPIPRIGVIADSPPNAFTYGRGPSSARLVLTRGIFEHLDEKEICAVIGHEIGHIAQRDFVFMTLAQVVPVVIYQVYRILISASRSKNSANNSNNIIAAPAVLAYLAYLTSEYTLLYLSRVREFWADRFGAHQCKDPNVLMIALIKIAYGLSASASGDGNHRAMQSMGIADTRASTVMGLHAAQNKLGKPTFEDAKLSMQWDLWNPWASYYEVQSTHPFLAERINALAVQARSMGVAPAFAFDLTRPESYWNDFWKDMFFISLPVTLPILVVVSKLPVFLIFVAFGIGYAAKTYFSYPFTGFSPFTILSLLKKIKVSGVRGIPVTITGTVIGRGIPEFVYSRDLVIRDETGLIFLDYEQPASIFNLWFSVSRSKSYIGQTVTVKGWYRRDPMPNIEIHNIRCGLEEATSYVMVFKYAFAIAALVGGYFFAHRV